ncbi:MAG: TetR/AcrR family transcriptional regulator [Lautropia sp.]|nr:TetR/AcrR family transcriptional regulator [Lautropia sp.]
MTVRSRGRPRAYDPEQALDRALHAFWKGGFSGTSLDALTEATGMNRPSLYAGLGDKRTMYLKAMRHFQEHARQEFAEALSPRSEDRSFADVIARYLQTAIKVDGPQNNGTSGCAVISTATAEALSDPEIQQFLEQVLRGMDEQVRARLQTARDNGEIAKDADLEALVFLMTSSAHSIGIRARAGEGKEELERKIAGLARSIFLSTQ